jgi:hypothetical protein
MPKRKTVDKAYQDLIQDIDVKALQESIETFFAYFPDPRQRWIYPAWYLILLILCGYLCGCNTIADIAHFAEVRYGWLISYISHINTAGWNAPKPLNQ